MDKRIANALDYIQEMKKFRNESIGKHDLTGIRSLADAYSYGYDKGCLSELEFIEFLLIS